jgi:GDP/UDP-N,N'-diacetylbacillosamine 2-epimerase (hydrolysing)
MRKICYISGTRADFGLMKCSLQAIDQDEELKLEVVVTGMHLLSEYGNTYREICDAGLNVIGKVKVALSGESGSQMSTALGEQIIGLTKVLEKSRPDLILLLGDRGEMLAGAIVALHLNIPIVHIHGGELSGTVDESIRHAISKMSHYHFTATNNSKSRLIKMGELSDNIFVIGAPGLDEISTTTLIPKEALFSQYNIDSNRPLMLLLFHPVVQHVNDIREQIVTVIESLISFDMQILALMPNADAGGGIIASTLKEYKEKNKIQITTHVTRKSFLSLVSYADVLVGNSSSGIIEAVSLGTPVVNIGSRQNLRERSNNVVDVSIDKSKIINGINKAMLLNKSLFKNVYGDGKSSKRIINLLKSLDLNPKILDKINAY